MKRVYSLFCSLWILLGIYAQQYPSEWSKYTNDGFLYDIQSSSNDNNISETDFKNYLLNIARTNLAKQIQVRVHDVANLNKFSKDGHSSITYSSNTNFTTDVELKLVETKAVYDSTTKEGYAIAYIDRNAARNYYKNELTLIYNKIDNSIALSTNFAETGFKSKARLELESSLQLFELVDEPLSWLNVFGASQAELSEWGQRFNTKEQILKRMLEGLKHAIAIYLSCSANIFEKSYPALQNELKGLLAADGCNFTNNPAIADWSITITCNTREHSVVNIGNSKSYFSYVDAYIIIDKTPVSLRIYENQISIKGGHTMGYSEAARTGYKKISNKIYEIIKDNIDE